MHGSLEITPFTKSGFDNTKYKRLQRQNIVDRIDRFNGGKLYLEIGGGKILHDPHASRVLPGYLPDNKKTILKNLANITELLFCVNSQDLAINRQLSSNAEDYADACFRMISELETETGIKAQIALTLCSDKTETSENTFISQANAKGYQVARRFIINGYPSNIPVILSENGFGKDEYLSFSKPLVVITGAASNSGKLSTALGQLYQDHQNGIVSGYAKFELFPIWSLQIEHPVNLAYEAATADIGDFNQIDTFHLESYGQKTVNYNRDVAAFPVVKGLADKIVSKDNAMREYLSPTDMGINFAGKAIIDDEVVCLASLDEIRRRSEWYTEIVARGQGDQKWITKCNSLEKRALRYIKEQGYLKN